MKQKQNARPSWSPDAEFAPFIPACQAHGVQKTTAYALLADGLLDSFLIGRRRFVRLESLRTLPERLRKRAETAGAAHG